MKIGILGMGSIGRRHYDNFKSLGCVVTGYDPHMDMWKGKIVEDGLKDCDGIVIASPSAMHFQHIVEYHRLNLLVEKPIVMTEQEVGLLSKTSHIKMVGYNLRFHSCVYMAKKWMGQGLIGKPLWARFICAQYNDRPSYLRDGVILNWSHEIDLALHLLGPATVLNSVVERGEAYANINLRHSATGCDTNIHLDYITRPERRGFTIVGELGAMTADLVTRQIYVKNNDGALLHNFAFTDSFDMNYRAEAKAFMELIEGRISQVHYCTAQEAMEVVKVCLAAKEMASV